MLRPVLVAWKRLTPLLLALCAAVGVGYAVRQLTIALLGPPGFEVVTTGPKGANPTRTVTPYLFAPDVIPTAPEGGSREARATFLAPQSGIYNFTLGSTATATLKVDGAELIRTPNDRSQHVDRPLEAGLHTLEISVARVDHQGGLVLAVRPPGGEWRGPLIGPGDAVALPKAELERKLGPGAPRIVRALPWAPWAVVVWIAGWTLLLIGARRRRAAWSYLVDLTRDSDVRRIAAGAAVVALTLPMLAPMSWPSYYACHEEESYMVRLHQFQVAIEAGVPMGRWWPDPVLGRGYPMLCLYAPLLYLLAYPLLLIGIGVIPILKLIGGLVIVVGAVAVYKLARRRVSRPAALFAVAAFTYAPYFNTDLYIRADIAETLVFATFPLALLALDRVLDEGAGRGEVALLGLAVAALGISHNITSYFSIYFLGVWFFGRLALRTADRAGFKRMVLGGLLGFAATAFFTVPAIFDRGNVWIERIAGGFYYYGNNFVPIEKAFVGWRRWDMALDLGLPATAGVAAALVAAAVARRRARFRDQPRAVALAVIGVVGTLVAIALITKPIGFGFARFVPLARFIGFPWRLYLFAATYAALAGAGAIDAWFPAGGRRRGVAAAVAIGLLLAIRLGPTGPRGPLLRKHLYEQEMLHGMSVDYVTSMNEYLPSTVKRTVPDFGRIAHLLSADGAIGRQERAPGRYRVEVAAKKPVVVELNAHWFPGWRATLDGREVPIGPVAGAPFDAGGLIRVAVPAGDHAVEIRYGRTPLRLACDLASALLVVGLGAVYVASRRRKRE
jgi:hypothetical protein